MTKKLITVLFAATQLSALSVFAVADESLRINSPDGRVAVELNLDGDQPNWSVSYAGEAVLVPGRLGMRFSTPSEGGYKSLSVTRAASDDEWNPVWGRFSTIRDHYNELVWELQEVQGQQRRIAVVIRAYDAGVAVRYRLDEAGDAFLKQDLTCFSFAGDFTCWSPNGERANIGPVRLSKYNGHQFPLTVKVSDTCYASVLEADIKNMPYVIPKRVGSTAFVSAFKGAVPEISAAETSWRVLLLGENPGDLLVGNLLENLNPSCGLEDASWVKPGLAMWDWRAWGGKGDDGFVYNLDMASWRRMIDFASKYGIEYLVLDANWYGHEFDPKSNPVTSRDYIVYQPDPTRPKMADRPAPEDWDDPVDVPKLIQYGRERNVGVMLYINDVARDNYDFDQTLATYQAWGAAGIKYGFMRGTPSEKVRKTREIVKACAKYRLHCNFHDNPVPPSGDVRTFPNYLAREFNHAQCDAGRSFTPKTFCTTVFCNMLAGPLDMCNGFMSLTDLEKGRPKVFKPVPSTVAAEAARVLITFSGLAFLPDTPESYESKADLFEFIASLPMTWDETKILNAEIGAYITTARRNGDRWFIASCANENGADLPINLDFLREGVTYDATLYEDTSETHYVDNKEAYRIRRMKMKKGDAITAKLAPGGGHCIKLVPAEKRTPPNIVVINVDDLGWNDVSFMPDVKSPYYAPTIEKLAQASVVFTDAYAAAPVCSPTRASLLTGKSPAALGLTTHIPGKPSLIAGLNKGKEPVPAKSLGHLPLTEITFAEVLREQGYCTGFIGKWHLAGEGSVMKSALRGMVNPDLHPEGQGFDLNIGGCAYGQPASYYDPYKNGTIKDRKKGDYLTDRLADEVISFIESNKDEKFLLYLNPYSVHTPIRAPSERVNQVRDKVKGRGVENPTYAAMIYSVDQMVGKLLQCLESHGLRENTLIIFTSDNGGHFQNTPLRDRKGSLYEGGIRVPFIVSWPAVIKAQKVSREPVISYDIFPTLLSAAQCPDAAPAGIEGQSLMPLIEPDGVFIRERPLIWHFPHYRHNQEAMGCAIRKDEWKLMYSFETEKVRLFNLLEDPGEKQDLSAAQPKKTRLLQKELFDILAKLRAEMPGELKMSSD